MHCQIKIEKPTELKIIKAMNNMLSKDKHEIRDYVMYFIKTGPNLYATNSNQLARFTWEGYLDQFEDGLYTLNGKTLKDSVLVGVDGDYNESMVNFFDTNFLKTHNGYDTEVLSVNNKNKENISLFICQTILLLNKPVNIDYLQNLIKTDIPIFDIIYRKEHYPVVFESKEDCFSYSILKEI